MAAQERMELRRGIGLLSHHTGLPTSELMNTPWDTVIPMIERALKESKEDLERARREPRIRTGIETRSGAGNGPTVSCQEPNRP